MKAGKVFIFKKSQFRALIHIHTSEFHRSADEACLGDMASHPYTWLPEQSVLASG